MDWSRLVDATFALSCLVVYLYGQQSISPWWQRYLVFVGGVLVLGLVWRVLALVVGPASTSDVRPVVLLAGILFGAWLAYFGGLDRLRGESS